MPTTPRNPNTMIEFRVWDREQKRVRLVRYYGKLYNVDGRMIKLFTIHVLAKALDRAKATIRKWEHADRFPRPMFRVPGNRTKRWYSEAQILRLNEIALRYRVQGKGVHLNVDAMLQEYVKVFYAADFNEIQKEEGHEQT